MLMLTRRQKQRILFPALGVSVEVVEVSGKTVRLGIDAPREIKVLREELHESEDHQAKAEDLEVDELISHLNDPIKEKLDSANLALHLAQNQLKNGLNEYATGALKNALDCLASLEDSVRDELQRLESNPRSNEAKRSTRQYRQHGQHEVGIRESSSPYAVDRQVEFTGDCCVGSSESDSADSADSADWLRLVGCLVAA